MVSLKFGGIITSIEKHWIFEKIWHFLSIDANKWFGFTDYNATNMPSHAVGDDTGVPSVQPVEIATMNGLNDVPAEYTAPVKGNLVNLINKY